MYQLYIIFHNIIIVYDTCDYVARGGGGSGGGSGGVGVRCTVVVGVERHLQEARHAPHPVQQRAVDRPAFRALTHKVHVNLRRQRQLVHGKNNIRLMIPTVFFYKNGDRTKENVDKK